jgi:DNA-binding CsgD family transcriptional regulator
MLTTLSPREREVFHLLVLGHTSAEAAQVLSISPRTVEAHRLRLQRKLGLATRAQLVRLAIGNGFFDAPISARPEASPAESAAAAGGDARTDSALREARR